MKNTYNISRTIFHKHIAQKNCTKCTIRCTTFCVFLIKKLYKTLCILYILYNILYNILCFIHRHCTSNCSNCTYCTKDQTCTILYNTVQYVQFSVQYSTRNVLFVQYVQFDVQCFVTYVSMLYKSLYVLYMLYTLTIPVQYVQFPVQFCPYPRGIIQNPCCLLSAFLLLQC